jgi:hypothetical protein
MKSDLHFLDFAGHKPRIGLLLSCILPSAFCFLSVAGDVSPNPANPKPGMERCAWSIEAWGNGGTVERTTVDGKKLLKLIFGGGAKDKTAYKHLTCFGIASAGKISFDAYSDDEKPPQLAMALSTSQTYQWHESNFVELKKGWNHVEFSIGEKVWKTEASKWQHEVSVAAPDDIRGLDILLYAGKKQGIVYVQGISYDPDENGKKIAAMTADLQSDDIDKRSAAEKALVMMGRTATEALYQIEEDDRPEVMLRAASALRQIEAVPEAPPADPTKRAELTKQKEDNNFEELRRNAAYTLTSMEAKQAQLLGFMQEAQKETAAGRAKLDDLKAVDVEKRKAYLETLDKIDSMIKDLGPLYQKKDEPKKPEMKKEPEPKKEPELKKADELKLPGEAKKGEEMKKPETK